MVLERLFKKKKTKNKKKFKAQLLNSPPHPYFIICLKIDIVLETCRIGEQDASHPEFQVVSTSSKPRKDPLVSFRKTPGQ